MIAPETLLTMHPEDALRAQIGEVLSAPLKASYLKIQPPRSLGGTLTEVEVSIDKTRCPVDLWGIDGTTVFKYHRLDLEAFTSAINKVVNATPPLDSVDVLRAIFDRYQIPVDNKDLVPAQFLELGQVNLLAADASYRWVGEMQAVIALEVLDILTLILVNQFTIPFDTQFYSSNIKARLTTLLNMANASSLPITVTESMFTLGEPQENGLFADGDNTKLTLQFSSIPYSGNLDVYYQRRSFEITLRFPEKISGPQLENTAQLATTLSAQMGCVITAADIRSEPFPALALGETRKVAVNFNSNSLAYVGTVLVKYSRTT